MSFKYQVIKDTDNRFVLPQVGDMNCEVVAFLNDELNDGTDEKLWQQAAGSASYPGVTHVFLMPDTHLGYGVPIGGVVITEGTLIQAGSGYDISCGVLYMKAKMHASEVVDPEKRRAWIEAIEKRIATGVGSHQPELMKSADHGVVQSAFLGGAAPFNVSATQCERLFIPVDEDYFDPNRIEKAISKAAPQMGSLGGGNHFIEMQVDPKDGSVWLMVHCGSRGFGWQTANHYYYAGAEARGLVPKQREKSWLYMDEPLGKEYWAHHNAAANYAIANRHTIAMRLREATQEVFNADAEVYYEISHNLIQEETVVLPDGLRVTGFVHRKGATRALPAGHPDLFNTAWDKTGHPCLIPGSMSAGAAILFPKDSAKSGQSVNHGSGRLMGRGQAKRAFTELQGVIDDEMSEAKVTCEDGTEVEGIVLNSEKTPLDECGHAYKDLDTVLGILEAENIAKVEHRMYPVANIKAMD